MTEPTRIVPDKGQRSGYLAAGGGTIAAKLIVKRSGAAQDQIVKAGAGELALGVLTGALTATATKGAWGTVQTDGKAIVTSGAAVTAGASVAADAAGKAVAGAAGDYIIGTAVTSTTGGDQDLEVELRIGASQHA